MGCRSARGIVRSIAPCCAFAVTVAVTNGVGVVSGRSVGAPPIRSYFIFFLSLGGILQLTWAAAMDALPGRSRRIALRRAPTPAYCERFLQRRRRGARATHRQLGRYGVPASATPRIGLSVATIRAIWQIFGFSVNFYYIYVACACEVVLNGRAPPNVSACRTSAQR